MSSKAKKLDWKTLSKKKYKARVEIVKNLPDSDAQELCTCFIEFVRQKKKRFRLEPELQDQFRRTLYPHRNRISQFMKKRGKGRVKEVQSGGFQLAYKFIFFRHWLCHRNQAGGKEVK